jgi:hypothetical protein
MKKIIILLIVMLCILSVNAQQKYVLHSFDLDSLYKSYIPKVLETKNDYEFYHLMELFASSFKDLHTEVSYREGNAYKKYIPLVANYFGNDLYIVSSHTNPELPKILKISQEIDKEVEIAIKELQSQMKK